MNELKSSSYIGIIKEGSVLDNTGRYLVDIPELNADNEIHKPILAKNEIIGNRFSRWIDIVTKDVKSQGAYHPLYPGMKVEIKFRNNFLESAYISNIISSIPLIDKESNRDSFYLLNKTLNGSWIYQDDSRNITHIMQNNGSSNIILTPDSVTLSIGKVNNHQFFPTNTFQLSSSNCSMTFGNSSIILDETGISLKVGETKIVLTESSLKMLSEGNVEVESKKTLNFQGSKAYLNGKKETHIYSNITRVSGGTNLTLSGSVINATARSLLSLTSTLQVNIKGLVKTAITGGMIEVISVANLYLSASVVHLVGDTAIVDGGSLTLNGGSIMMDGTITHGVGVAASVAKAMKATNIGLSASTDAANIAVVTPMQLTTSVMGVANSIMTASLPGSANAGPNIVKPIFVNNHNYSGVSEKINYVLSSNEAFNLIVKDQVVNLHNTHQLRSI